MRSRPTALRRPQHRQPQNPPPRSRPRVPSLVGPRSRPHRLSPQLPRRPPRRKSSRPRLLPFPQPTRSQSRPRSPRCRLRLLAYRRPRSRQLRRNPPVAPTPHRRRSLLAPSLRVHAPVHLVGAIIPSLPAKGCPVRVRPGRAIIPSLPARACRARVRGLSGLRRPPPPQVSVRVVRVRVARVPRRVLAVQAVTVRTPA